MSLYGHYKALYSSNPIDNVMKDHDEIINGYEVIHTPGHCPGEICLRVDNFLITGDHILPGITPHQSPASIVLFCGLDNYLNSLMRVRKEKGIDRVLPGHGNDFEGLQKRIDEIVDFHYGRLLKVLEICRESKTIAEISKALFGTLQGYNRLLGLQEAGAHVEYLWERGALRVENVEEIADHPSPVYRYVRGSEAILKQLSLL
jgi:glyoxylase-like metal-dependent hydrolase (beta-lactamase superfamily II)